MRVCGTLVAVAHVGRTRTKSRDTRTIAVLAKDISEAEVVLDEVVVECLEIERLESRPQLPVHRHDVVVMQIDAVKRGYKIVKQVGKEGNSVVAT